MALVFVGFMGAGKSSAFDDLLDTDTLMDEQLGMTIAQFFAVHGERRFRSHEEEVVLRALRSGAPGIALGGGAVMSERVRNALADHTVVWMDVSDETAWARAAGDDRPLARDRGAFTALHAERRPLYESVADAFLPEGDRLVRRALPALESLRDAPAGTKLVYAATAGGEYPVFVGRGLIGGLPRPGRRAFVVTDENVAAHYAGALQGAHHTITIAAGEEHKTLAVAGQRAVVAGGPRPRRLVADVHPHDRVVGQRRPDALGLHRPAAERDPRGTRAQRAQDDLLLMAAKAPLAVDGEELRDRHPELLLEQPVGVEDVVEGRGLAGPHEADEN